ncbi:MAG: hypothetical protein QF464_12520, partial [Myxococcota bacterium]|nr:hypothetical protein [Myxococcota bacterium]
NGEYCRDARLLDGDDTQHIRDLDLAGHVMGSHFHTYQLTDADEYWESVPKSAATEEVLQAIWDAQLGECEEALGHEVYRIDPALDSSVTDATAFVQDHKLAYGVAVEPAGEAFSYAHWNHKPWNPFRKKPGTKLTEDHTHPMLGVMSVPQTGQVEPQGKHQVMASVPQIQRQFMMLVAEWRERERAGDSPRLWTFGIMTHPNDNAAHREDMEAIVAWLKTWTETVTAKGNAVAEFATDADIVQRYEAWEAKNPGASSFDYDWEAYLAGDIWPYPYWVEGATLGLKDCDYIGEFDLGPDVQAYEFANREVLRSPPNAEGISVMNIGELRLPVFMLWSHGGPSSVADLSGSVTGTVFVRDGLTGEVTTADASQITVPVHPVIVCETDDYWP